MADVLCFVGLLGVIVAILLIVILSFMDKNTWAALGLFALCVLIILGSGFLPSEESQPDDQGNVHSGTPANDTISPVLQDTDVDFQDTVPDSDMSNSFDGVYKIGETWTVDGQWSVTVTGVSETIDRNQYFDKTPEAVYILDFTYTNLGYTDDYSDGIFISLGGNGTIVDSTGMMAYEYPGDVTNYAKETPVGATCIAQSCIGVDNAGDFKIIYSTYDGNEIRQTATFLVEVG